MAVYLNKLTGDGANLISPRTGFLTLYYDVTERTLKVKDENGEIFAIDDMLHLPSKGIDNVVKKQTSFAIGTSNCVNGENSLAVGEYNTTNGDQNLAVGSFNEIDGDDSVAFGKYVEVSGDQSFGGGLGDTDDNKLTVSGDTSFSHSSIDASYTGNGLEANNAAILGGLNNSITSGSNRSVILGGNSIIADEADTVYSQNLINLGYLRIGPNKGTTTEVTSGEVLGNIKFNDGHFWGFAETLSAGGSVAKDWIQLDADLHLKTYVWGEVTQRDPITNEITNILFSSPNATKREEEALLRLNMSDGTNFDIDMTDFSRNLREIQWNGTGVTVFKMSPNDPSDELILDQTELFDSKLDKVGGVITGDLEVCGISTLWNLNLPNSVTIEDLTVNTNTLLKGSTQIGVSAGDSLNVMASSTFKSDVTSEQTLIANNVITGGSVTIGTDNTTKMDVNSRTEFNSVVISNDLSTFNGEVITNDNFKSYGNTFIGNDKNVDNMTVDAAVIINGVTTIDEITTLNSNLIVKDDATFEKTTTSQDGVITNTFNVSGATILNTLEVSGATTLDSTIVNGTLKVSTDNDSEFLGNVTVGENVNRKDITLHGNLNVTNDVVVGTQGATPPTNVTINSNTVLGGSLTMTNPNAVFTGTNMEMTGNLEINGSAIIGSGGTDELEVDGDFIVKDNNNTTLGGTLRVKDNTDLEAALRVGTGITVVETAVIGGTAVLNSTLEVSDKATFRSGITTLGTESSSFGGDINTSGNVHVVDIHATGSIIVDQNLTIKDNATIHDNLEVCGSTLLQDNVITTKDVVIGETLITNGGSLFKDGIVVEKTTTGKADFKVDMIVGTVTDNNNTVMNGTLDVSKKGIFSDDVEVEGDLIIGGTAKIENLTIDSDLTVLKNTTLGGTAAHIVTVNGTTVFNSPVSVATSPVSLGGTLNVTNATALGDVLTVSDKATFSNDVEIGTALSTGGLATLHSLIVENNTNLKTTEIDGSLSVDGLFTVESGNASWIKDSLKVTGNVTLESNLETTVGSLVDIKGDLTVSSDTDLKSTLNVDGISIFNNAVTISGTNKLISSGELEVNGITNLNNAVNVPNNKLTTSSLDVTNPTANNSVSGSLTVGNKITTNTLDVNAATCLKTTLALDGKMTANGGIDILGGDVIINEDLTVGSDVIFNKGLFVNNQKTELNAGLKVDSGLTVLGGTILYGVSESNGSMDLKTDVELNSTSGVTNVHGILGVKSDLITDSSTTSTFNGHVITKNSVILGDTAADTTTAIGDIVVKNALIVDKRTIKMPISTGSSTTEDILVNKTTLVGSTSKNDLNWNGDRILTTHTFQDELIENLKDVVITSATLSNDQVLVRDNDKFVNKNIIKSMISDFSETDYLRTNSGILQTVSGDVTFTGSEINISNKLTVADLTVTGTTITTNASNLNITNRFITINESETGAGITASNQLAGIVVDRGTAQNAALLYDDSDHMFKVGFQSSSDVATDTPEGIYSTKKSLATRTEDITPTYNISPTGIINGLSSIVRENGIAYWTGVDFTASDVLRWDEVTRTTNMSAGNLSLVMNGSTLWSYTNSNQTITYDYINNVFTNNVLVSGILTSNGSIVNGNLATTTITASGNISADSVGVVGTIEGEALVSRTSMATSTLTATGAINGGTLVSTGLATLGSVNVSGLTNLSILTVTGSTITNSITNTGLVSTDTLTTTGLVRVNSLEVDQTAIFKQGLTSNAATITNINGIFNAAVAANFAGLSTFNGNTIFNNDVTISGGNDINVGGKITSTDLETASILTTSTATFRENITSEKKVLTQGLSVLGEVANFSQGITVSGGNVDISGGTIDVNHAVITDLDVSSTVDFTAPMTNMIGLYSSGNSTFGAIASAISTFTGHVIINNTLTITNDLIANSDATIQGTATIEEVIINNGFELKDGDFLTYNSYVPASNNDVIDFKYLTANYDSNSNIDTTYLKLAGGTIAGDLIISGLTGLTVATTISTANLTASGDTTLENITVNTTSTLTGNVSITSGDLTVSSGKTTTKEFVADSVESEVIKLNTIASLPSSPSNGTTVVIGNYIKTWLNAEWADLNIIPTALTTATSSTLTSVTVSGGSLPTINEDKIVDVDVNSFYYQDMANHNFTKLMNEHNSLKADYEALVALLKVQNIIA